MPCDISCRRRGDIHYWRKNLPVDAFLSSSKADIVEQKLSLWRRWSFTTSFTINITTGLVPWQQEAPRCITEAGGWKMGSWGVSVNNTSDDRCQACLSGYPVAWRTHHIQSDHGSIGKWEFPRKSTTSKMRAGGCNTGYTGTEKS